jgi:DcmR-like sensory protein
VRKKTDTFHAVRFYDSEAALCRIVANFLREGLAIGQPALVIATSRHSLGIVAELRAREFDVNALREAGTLAVLDVEEALAGFIVDRLPDADRFRETATAAIDKVRGPTRATVRVYSETVDLLWKQGRDTVAIQVEMLWNKLARSNDFTLLCGCAMGSFVDDASIQEVCRQHTHLVSSDGTARISNADSLLVGALKL